MTPGRGPVLLTLPGLLLIVGAHASQDGASTAGFARSSYLIERGVLPKPEEVVVADLIDWHRHALAPPKAGDPLALDVRFETDAAAVGDAVWLQVGIATARAIDLAELPPLALALVVDCSGSMAGAGKIGYVREGLCELAARLRPEDHVALVAYSTEARVVRPLAPVGDGRALRCAIETLEPGASTNLDAGLQLGFAELAEAPRGSPRRCLLLTDGIANEGVTDPGEILARARHWFEQGLDLATIGVGSDLNHDLLARLARGGRGLFHFVGDGRDLTKVFVEDLQSLLLPVARQVRLEVELPRGWVFDHVAGHAAERTAAGFALSLDDLQAGATRVVLARLRAGRGGRVHARLSFEEAAGKTPREIAACGALAGTGRPRAFDPEVRKNATIAELAEALHDAAVLAAVIGAAGRGHGYGHGSARELLASALQATEGRYPDGGDEDVRRVADLVRGALRTCTTVR